MSRCRACGAEVRRVFTQWGGRIALDAEPVEGGDVVLRGDTAYVIGDEDAVPKGEPRWNPHAASCTARSRSG